MRKDLHYFKYYDHYKNGNTMMTSAELQKNLQAPVILESFGPIKCQDTTYIVVENLTPKELHFIVRSSVIMHEVYQKVESK